MPGVSGVTVVTMLVCFFILHARLRVHRAPGIPCALNSTGGMFMAKLAPVARRDREIVPMHEMTWEVFARCFREGLLQARLTS